MYDRGSTVSTYAHVNVISQQLQSVRQRDWQYVIADSFRCSGRIPGVTMAYWYVTFFPDWNIHLTTQGAIELPLRCATVWDPENRALEWRPPARSLLEHNASPAGTIATLHPYGPVGIPDHAAAIQEAWEIRMRCYDLALGSLGAFNDGQGAISDADYSTAVNLREDAWKVAFSSPDSVFHARLYDWCMERGLTDILLNVSLKFLS